MQQHPCALDLKIENGVLFGWKFAAERCAAAGANGILKIYVLLKQKSKHNLSLKLAESERFLSTGPGNGGSCRPEAGSKRAEKGPF